jgi:hypothetical protein
METVCAVAMKLPMIGYSLYALSLRCSMSLLTKRYMFYIDAKSTIIFSMLADTARPISPTFQRPFYKKLAAWKEFFSKLKLKLKQKRQSAVEDNINTLLP